MNPNHFKAFTFPGGERHVTVEPQAIGSHATTAILRSSDDILDLALAAEILSRSPRMPELIMPYIPYARQDRATTGNSAFSLKAFATILNGLNFPKVHVYEPHSDVAPALISNCVIHHCDAAVAEYLWELQDLGLQDILLFAPDAGAEKRVSRVHKNVSGERSVLGEVGQAIKHRNPSTGWVEVSFVTPNVNGRNVLVVDDICDGGATFNQLAPALKDAGAKSLHLFVAHGIFSKGIDELRTHYQTIATTDSFYDGRFGEDVYTYNSID